MVPNVRLLKASERKLFEQVVALGNRNKAYLGLLPEGGLADYAKSGNIIIALDGDQLLGYLLFRLVTTRNRASIIHLCVDNDARGKGIANALFGFLTVQTRHLNGIILTCRRDFTYASKLWERLGFVPVNERPGRGDKTKVLVTWWYSNPTRDLFSQQFQDDRADVALDANIFYALCDPSRQPSPDVLPLLDDWLSTEIRMVISDEMYNEIARCEDPVRRRITRQQARGYEEIRYDKEERDDILRALDGLFQREPTDRNLSDLRQVANAIAGGCPYFLTHDGGVRDRAPQIKEQFGLEVMRPVELISNLDQITNSHRYQPQWMGAHHLDNRRVRGTEVDTLAHAFVAPPVDGVKSLRHRLRSFVAKPDEYTCNVVEDTAAGIHHCLVVGHHSKQGVDLVLFRESRRRLSLRLLERQLKWITLEQAASGFGVLQISDAGMSESALSLLPDYGFWKHPSGGDKWYKYVGAGTLPLEVAQQHVATLDSTLFGTDASPLAKRAGELERGDLNGLMELERALWPLKIKETQVPCYIVSVQPRWARYLFDEKLSMGDMFGSNTELLFSRRNVYYSGALTNLQTPARILWYVSQDKQHTISALRAASYLDKVVSGPPKEIFKQFESLGAFKWEHISALAEKKARVQAFLFSDTEPFDRGVSYKEVQVAFGAEGRPAPLLLGPTAISPELYLALYAKGWPKFTP